MPQEPFLGAVLIRVIAPSASGLSPLTLPVIEIIAVKTLGASYGERGEVHDRREDARWRSTALVSRFHLAENCATLHVCGAATIYRVSVRVPV